MSSRLYPRLSHLLMNAWIHSLKHGNFSKKVDIYWIKIDYIIHKIHRLLQTKKKYEKVLLKKMLKKPNNIVGVDVNVNKQLHHINFLYKEKDIITKNNCTKEE